MSTKLSNNEIQKQLSKEEIEKLKKDKQKQLDKVVKK
jgi:hypothetical protein